MVHTGMVYRRLDPAERRVGQVPVLAGGIGIGVRGDMARNWVDRAMECLAHPVSLLPASVALKDASKG